LRQALLFALVCFWGTALVPWTIAKAESVLIENKRGEKVKLCAYRSDDRSVFRSRKCWMLKKSQKILWDRGGDNHDYDVRVFGPGIFELPICYQRRIAQNYRLEVARAGTGTCVTAKYKARVNVRDWHVGNRVLANGGFDNYWYPATILENLKDSYRVRFDNRKVEILSSNLIAKLELQPAISVETNWRKFGRWYPVELISQGDRNAMVAFPDGIKEEIPISLIRVELPTS